MQYDSSALKNKDNMICGISVTDKYNLTLYTFEDRLFTIEEESEPAENKLILENENNVILMPAKDYDSVRVAVWSEENNSDDLTWYDLTYSENDRRWTGNIDLKNIIHKGVCIIHAYNGQTFLAGTSFEPDENCIASNRIETSYGENGRGISVETTKKYDKMRIAIWSEENGQDDIAWYDMNKSNDHSFNINLKTLKLLHPGTVIAHIYSGDTFVESLTFTAEEGQYVHKRLCFYGIKKPCVSGMF